MTDEKPYKSFGDEWLEFHDFINGCPLDLIIECDLNIGTGFLNPHELSYYIGAKNLLQRRMECSLELKTLGKEAKTEDVNKILKKYHLEQLPIDKPVENKDLYQ